LNTAEGAKAPFIERKKHDEKTNENIAVDYITPVDWGLLFSNMED
jgi:hypothetical protein